MTRLERPSFIDMVLVGLVVITLLYSASWGMAPDTSINRTAKTKSIIVFKNGLGFFQRDARLTLNNGWGVMDIPDHATLGTFWIGSPEKGVMVEEVVGFKDKITKSIEAVSLDELLKSNIGKRITLLYGSETITGTIQGVPGDRKVESAAVDYSIAPRYNYYNPAPLPVNPITSASLIYIKTSAGMTALNRNLINKVEFLDTPNLYTTKEETVNKLKVKISNKISDADVGVCYLQKGISWMPSYLVDISDPDKAKVTMKCTLINDAEDLDDANLFFTVGYPNFAFSDVINPMTLEQSLSQFINSLNQMEQQRSSRYGGGMAQVMSQSVMYNYYAGDMGVQPASYDYGYTSGAGAQGAANEDLFFYDLKDINLKKGERAEYPMFTTTVDYKHVYEWTIPDLLHVDIYGYKQSYDNSRRPDQELVWHSIKLNNSSEYPWTTAPALTISGAKALAQDTLRYTSKGSKSNLKLTVATDVRTDRKEEELSRVHNVNINNANYDQVTIQGSILVKNLKSKEVFLEVNKLLIGEVLSVSNDGKVVKRVEGLQGVNNSPTITWNLPLKPDEEITLTYKYQIYVR